MAVFDETPAQEAARINAASGDPEGITAEQVERNRNLNSSLSGFLGRKPDGSPLDPTAPKPGLPNGVARTITGEWPVMRSQLAADVAGPNFGSHRPDLRKASTTSLGM